MYVDYNLRLIKTAKLDLCKMDGGKIAEKANALSNVNDTKIRRSLRMLNFWPAFSYFHDH